MFARCLQMSFKKFSKIFNNRVNYSFGPYGLYPSTVWVKVFKCWYGWSSCLQIPSRLISKTNSVNFHPSNLWKNSPCKEGLRYFMVLLIWFESNLVIFQAFNEAHYTVKVSGTTRTTFGNNKVEPHNF